MAENNCNKVIVIGLDGATFDVLIPMMERGIIPNIANLYNGGVYGDLESIIPYVSGPAWISFMTGKNPGKHGAFDWGVRQNRYSSKIVNSSFLTDKTLWQILSDNSRKVGIINVPLTYPPKKVNGFMITGMGTVGENATFTYPENLYHEILGKVGKYRVDLTTKDYKNKGPKEFLYDLMEMTRQRGNTTLYLMNKYNWDFFMMVFVGMDRIQHYFWSYVDPQSSLHRNDNQLMDLINDYYSLVDDYIGKIIKKHYDVNTFLISDHGFGPLKTTVYINELLAKKGYLTKNKKNLLNILAHIRKSMGITPEKVLKYCRLLGIDTLDIYKFESLSNFVSSVDWKRTLAFSDSTNGISINLKGREPKGIVRQGKEYEELKKEIIVRLSGTTLPGTGEKVFKKFYKREDLYNGPKVELASDIIFELHWDLWPSASFNSDNLCFKCNDDKEANFTAFTGSHRKNGIFIAKGMDIKKGTKLYDAKIIDIAPTILYLMGLPIPEDFDGKVLKDIFTTSYIQANPISYGGKAISRGDKNWIDVEDQKEVMRHLKGLGYFD